jgi:hypothetical protein
VGASHQYAAGMVVEMQRRSSVLFATVLVLLFAVPESAMKAQPRDTYDSTGHDQCGIGGRACEGDSGDVSIQRDMPRGQSTMRRLLLAGWEEATEVRPPQFVERQNLMDPKTGLPRTLRLFAHPGCADRPEWRFMWPTSLEGGFACEDYKADALNQYCASDVGFDFATGEWLTAQQGCPVACAACCEVNNTHCNSDPNPSACQQTCLTWANERANEGIEFADEYEAYLAHVDHISKTSLDLAMFRRHKNGEDTEFTKIQPELRIVHFDGRVSIDEKELVLFSSTPFSQVRYTIDGSMPSPIIGTVASHVRFEHTVQLKAVGFMPAGTNRSLAASTPAALDVIIQASQPTVTVIECEQTGGDTLYFTPDAPYTNQSCSIARVAIAVRRELGPRANTTRLRYAIDHPDPGSSNPQGRTRAVVTLVGPRASSGGGGSSGNVSGGVSTAGLTRVSARAWRANTLPSDVVLSPFILVGGGQTQALGWMGSVGWWKFVRSELTGTYERAVNRQGECQERLPTHIQPAAVSTETSNTNCQMPNVRCLTGG